MTQYFGGVQLLNIEYFS